jgi:hypothetical protein
MIIVSMTAPGLAHSSRVMEVGGKVEGNMAEVAFVKARGADAARGIGFGPAGAGVGREL